MLSKNLLLVSLQISTCWSIAGLPEYSSRYLRRRLDSHPPGPDGRQTEKSSSGSQQKLEIHVPFPDTQDVPDQSDFFSSPYPVPVGGGDARQSSPGAPFVKRGINEGGRGLSEPLVGGYGVPSGPNLVERSYRGSNASNSSEAPLFDDATKPRPRLNTSNIAALVDQANEMTSLDSQFPGVQAGLLRCDWRDFFVAYIDVYKGSKGKFRDGTKKQIFWSFVVDTGTTGSYVRELESGPASELETPFFWDNVSIGVPVLEEPFRRSAQVIEPPWWAELGLDGTHLEGDYILELEGTGSRYERGVDGRDLGALRVLAGAFGGNTTFQYNATGLMGLGLDIDGAGRREYLPDAVSEPLMESENELELPDFMKIKSGVLAYNKMTYFTTYFYVRADRRLYLGMDYMNSSWYEGDLISVSIPDEFTEWRIRVDDDDSWVARYGKGEMINDVPKIPTEDFKLSKGTEIIMDTRSDYTWVPRHLAEGIYSLFGGKCDGSPTVGPRKISTMGAYHKLALLPKSYCHFKCRIGDPSAASLFEPPTESFENVVIELPWKGSRFPVLRSTLNARRWYNDTGCGSDGCDRDCIGSIQPLENDNDPWIYGSMVYRNAFFKWDTKGSGSIAMALYNPKPWMIWDDYDSSSITF